MTHDNPQPQLQILSFGYRHHQPPADLTLDVRDMLLDPHVSPQMRHLTGLDARVRDHVMATRGAPEITALLGDLVQEMLAVATDTVIVAIGCTGGRHRSVVLASVLHDRIQAAGWATELHHLHINRPVLPSTRASETRGL